MNEETIQNRITLDFNSVRTDIEGVLDEIRVLRGERFFSRVLGNAAVQKLKDHETSIKTRLRDTFNLIVIGDFKRGKSMLINAILGEETLPTSVTPETVTINRVSYSETPLAEAVLKNGKRAALDYSELKRDIIERIIPQLPAPIDYIDVKTANPLLNDITVVDTPGLGDLLNAFDEQIATYLYNADALIYVVSVHAPFSASEQAFLASAVVPQSFSQIMVVVNMTDMLETETDIARVKAMTAGRAAAIGENVPVYMLSALDELCRKKGKARPVPALAKILEDNYLEFENALNRDIILQKDIIKSTRCATLTEIMLKDTAARIELIKNTLNAGAEKLNSALEVTQNQNSELRKNIDRHKAALAAVIDSMKTEAKTWMYDFMSRLKPEIQSARDSASMSDIERHFQFYMMDLIKNAVTMCVRHHQTGIADQTSSAVKEIAQAVTQEAFGEINTQITDNIADVSWTRTDTASFFANQFLGVSGSLNPMALVVQAVMGFVRQKTIARKQSDFITPVLQEYESITLEVTNGLNKIYDQLKFKTADILEETYQKQIEASAEAIRQVQDILQDETTKKNDVTAYLDELLPRIDGFRQILAKYK